MPTPIPTLTAPPGYHSQAEDTSVEADLLDFYLLRQRTSTERLGMSAALMSGARKLSLHCLNRRFGDLAAVAFARKLAETWLQEDCPPNYTPTGSAMTWIQDSTNLAVQLHDIFASLDVAYYVTGGVAAITYGEPRTTRDLDVVISVPRDALNPLADALEASGFYVPGIEDVARGRMRTIQVTHMETISRADLVVADDNAYEQLKFQRRRQIPWPNNKAIYVVSPEDIVVNKLRWGKRSQSDKQWRDVLGVLKTQQADLDYEYMYEWAVDCDLAEALERATLAAGVRAIADQQWAEAYYPIIYRAFEMAQERDRTVRSSSDSEVAEGKFYTLVQDATAQTLTAIAKLDDREIAQYDRQGQFLQGGPSLQDRRQWAAIALQIS